MRAVRPNNEMQTMGKGRYIFYTAIIAAALPLMSGCTKGFGIDDFRQESDIGLSVKGSYELRYDPANCQLGFNESRNEFWVTDDTMANYFILKCSSFPEVGKTVTADIVYTTETDLKSRSGLAFEVTGYDTQTGKISLWCQSGKIGVIVKVLR